MTTAKAEYSKPDHIRKEASFILKSKRNGFTFFNLDQDILDFDLILRRFQNDNDFGQAFKKKPTDAELIEILEWLSRLPG